MLNKRSPLVSIVIPCFNHEKYIQQCINSIIEQDYENIELIVIDDGSKDGSVFEIKKLVSKCKKRFTRFEFRERSNKGLCATLNEAIDWCKGEFYSAIASDDLMLKNKISTQIRYMQENEELACVFSNALSMDENGKFGAVIKKTTGKVNFKDFILFRKSVIAPTLLAKTKVIKDVGGYPENIIIEDWYMWLKLTKSGYLLEQMPDVLIAYRKHSANTSSKVAEMHSARLDILEFFKSSCFYSAAKSILLIQLAVELLNTDRTKSIKVFLLAVREKPSVFFCFKFYHYVVRFFLPYRLYSNLKKVF